MVFRKICEEHIERLGNIFQALRQAGLTLKLSKCDFARREVKYLVHIVSAAGLRPDPTKMKAVSTYPFPNSIKELRQFLGRRFVVDYSKIVGPLHKLLTKKRDWQWDSTCQGASVGVGFKRMRILRKW